MSSIKKLNVLVTGGGGFIGSNLTDALLNHEGINTVRVLDNFATGSRENLKEAYKNPNLEVIEGDIRELDSCMRATAGMDIVCHQAALGSVPRSINDPITTNNVNITGFLNMTVAAQRAGIQKFVYAASSSTYGDSKELPKVEDRIGKPLSPYAVTKFVNELYADVCANLYDMDFIGLRYFNVFGARQSPSGAYAAVIPMFMNAALQNEAPFINGDGSYSRDFTYVKNVVQANINAIFLDTVPKRNEVMNIAFGERTTLIELWDYIAMASKTDLAPIHRENRQGDIPHSLADITKAKRLINYDPKFSVKDGIQETWKWFASAHSEKIGR